MGAVGFDNWIANSFTLKRKYPKKSHIFDERQIVNTNIKDYRKKSNLKSNVNRDLRLNLEADPFAHQNREDRFMNWFMLDVLYPNIQQCESRL